MLRAEGGLFDEVVFAGVGEPLLRWPVVKNVSFCIHSGGPRRGGELSTACLNASTGVGQPITDTVHGWYPFLPQP